MDNIDPKPGYTTSEFWVTLGTVLISAVVAIGAEFGLHFNQDHLLALIPALAPVAAAIAAFAYSHSRANVKAAHLAALTALNTASPAVISHGTVNVVTGVAEDGALP